MLIVHFTVMMLHSSVATGKNREPTFHWHNREFPDAYPTFWYCNLTFPDCNTCSYHFIYLAFDDITTVIFTIITGSWTLFFQWQPGFLQWTGNFSCSVCLPKVWDPFPISIIFIINFPVTSFKFIRLIYQNKAQFSVSVFWFRDVQSLSNNRAVQSSKEVHLNFLWTFWTRYY